VEDAATVKPWQMEDKSLHSAAFRGQVDEVHKLVELKVDVRAPDEHGNTALHWAAFRGHTETVKAFIELGADVHAQDTDGHTALHWATRMGHSETVKALQLVEDAATVKPRHMEDKSLRSAAFRGQVDEVRKLVELKVDVRAPDGHGNTALHWAAFRGHTETVKALMKFGAHAHAQDKDGHTALHWATTMGHTETVKALLQMHDAATILPQFTQDKSKSLRNAAYGDQLDEVRKLVELKVDVSAPDGFGYTALHWATFRGLTEMVKALLELGADVHARDNGGRTALDWATRMGNAEMMKALQPLDDTATANTREMPDRNEIMRSAASKGQVDEVCKVFTLGADVRSSDEKGRTALHLAAYHGHTETVKALVGLGADVCALDENARTPLHLAAINGHT